MSENGIQTQCPVLPDTHGAFDYAELERLGLDPAQVVDFSVNSNPYGPSPRVREALQGTPLERYPDRECLALRRALSEHLGACPEQIVVGNGTAELLWLIALAFLRPGDDALILGPTFGEYRRAAQLFGAQVCHVTARAEQGFVADRREIIAALERIKPRICFICRPNNPTGATLPMTYLGPGSGRYPGTLFVVDEAYLSFAPGLISAQRVGAPNMLILRSMTKDYALAGLRLGYAIGPEPLIAQLAAVRPPWNVNALAQAAGIAALADQEHLQETMRALWHAREEFVAGLQGLGMKLTPSTTHFFLAEVGNGAAYRRELLRYGLLVRDCASFGLPEYIRIATRRPEENTRLLAAIREVGVWRE
jgi:histidinol-phosphate aminotransferase